jgi:hypothetical protein
LACQHRKGAKEGDRADWKGKNAEIDGKKPLKETRKMLWSHPSVRRMWHMAVGQGESERWLSNVFISFFELLEDGVRIFSSRHKSRAIPDEYSVSVS